MEAHTGIGARAVGGQANKDLAARSRSTGVSCLERFHQNIAFEAISGTIFVPALGAISGHRI